MKRILLILLALLPLVSGSLFLYNAYKNVEEQSIEHYEKINQLYIDQAVTGIELEFIRNDLEHISFIEEIINFSSRGQQVLDSYYDAHRGIVRAITRVDKNGILLYTSPFDQDAIGKDLSSQPHNVKIISEQKFMISEYFTAVQGYTAIAVIQPIFRDGIYDGCLSMLIPVGEFAGRYMNSIKIGNSSNAFVISENGIELFCNDRSHIGKDVYKVASEYPMFLEKLTKIIHTEEGTVRYDEEGHDNFLVYKSVHLAGTKWLVAIDSDINEYLVSNVGFKNRILAVSAIAFVSYSAFFLFFFMVRKKHLNQEIEHREQLEEIVKDRTQELEKTNKQLVEDIEIINKTKDELRKAKEHAELSEKLKSEFLAQMSHEIRTPINTILSFTSLIEMECEKLISQELVGSFQSIENAAKRLLRTIDLVLNMSAIESGILSINIQKLQLNDIILNTIREFKPYANEKNLKLFSTSIADRNTIMADEYTVSQIISNLVDNAIKYTEKGSVEVLLRNHNNEVTLTIRDTGIGIADEYLPNLFNKFTQEEQGYTRTYDGNGLGLALVKEYCKLNNAEIYVNSTKGSGTEFTVKFLNGTGLTNAVKI